MGFRAVQSDLRDLSFLRSLSAVSFLIAFLFLPGQGEAARRAFVVGNSNYAHVASLPNPANDAADLAAKLKALDYEVTLELDVGRAQFLRSFQAFSASLSADDLALVYFAGHGMQIGGENYLFPVDARVEKEDDAKQYLVPLNALLADLSRITRSRILILDACRNNPFADEIASGRPPDRLASRGAWHAFMPALDRSSSTRPSPATLRSMGPAATARSRMRYCGTSRYQTPMCTLSCVACGATYNARRPNSKCHGRIRRLLTRSYLPAGPR